MMINCIIPTHRPDFIASAVAAVRAQTVPTRVIVVENGPARGACVDADVVLQSRENAPAARNLGLRFVQQTGGLVSFFDDDDIYCPDHLATLLKAWPGHGIAGRQSHYLRTRDGRLLFLCFDGGSYVMVQSMLCLATDVGPWDEALPVEDVDVAWCLGKQLHIAPSEGFAFNNHPGPHLWAPDDHEWPIRCPKVYDLGPYDECVVQGTKAAPQGVLLPPSHEAVRAMFDRLKQRQALGLY